ncbi:MAG: hypothetical protein GX298_04915 [Planctomycetes bacterium]|nr:hypothetical protein [Planctomycetota bacterium]
MGKKRAIWISVVNVAILAAVFAGIISTVRAAGRDRDYIVAVEPQKSDTVRMIEAYERLSSQYLTLVQQNLVQMASTDRDILDKLAAIEKKLDALSVRLDRLVATGHTAPSSAVEQEN